VRRNDKFPETAADDRPPKKPALRGGPFETVKARFICIYMYTYTRVYIYTRGGPWCSCHVLPTVGYERIHLGSKSVVASDSRQQLRTTAPRRSQLCGEGQFSRTAVERTTLDFTQSNCKAQSRTWSSEFVLQIMESSPLACIPPEIRENDFGNCPASTPG